jgi:hypothetical protein
MDEVLTETTAATEPAVEPDVTSGGDAK